MTEPYTHTYLPPSPKESRERRGVPWWGILLIALGTFVSGFIVGAIVVAIGAEFLHEVRPVLTAGVGGDHLVAMNAQPGQCFEGSVDEEDTHSVVVIGAQVACQEVHISEVYARIDLPVGTDGEPEAYVPEDIEAVADGVCLMAFRRYVGEGYEDSALDYTPVIPSQQGWRAGDRAVHCLLHEWDGDPMTGSAKRTNR